MKKIFNLYLVIIVICLVTGGCKKNNEGYTAPPLEAHFAGKSGGTFYVLNSTSTFKVPIGLTNISTVDQRITISISSTTGAVGGTHYTVVNPNIVIKAGKAIDSIDVKSNFTLYSSGRKDTLIFKISQPGVKPTNYNSNYNLVLRGACVESNVNLNNFLGTYANTIETFANFGSNGNPYGPYTTTISTVNQLTPTTGTVTVTNIWNNGWGPISFILDWTDSTNRTATVIAQAAIPGSDAGQLNSLYTGVTMAVKPFPSGNLGTFSICNQTLKLKMQLGVTGAGYFNNAIYIVDMNR